MQVLDGKDHRGGRYERFVGDLVVDLLNGGKWWNHLEYTQPGAGPNPEAIGGLNLIFSTTLRELVDQYIRTGVDQDGIERPSNRRVRASAGEEPIPIFDTLLSWLQRNMPPPALMNEGVVAILEQRPRPDAANPDQYARDTAIYYFKDLLDSPARTRIGKCANQKCQKYFLRQRERRREIKRGAYCGECKLIGAAERTRLTRLRRKEAQIEVAAQSWEHRPLKLSDNRAVSWIASQVNRKFPRWSPITSKWVNQNKNAILKRIQEHHEG